jgi:hypothetical protein
MAYYNFNVTLTIIVHYVGNMIRDYHYFTDYNSSNQQIRLSPQHCHLLESTLFADSDMVCEQRMNLITISISIQRSYYTTAVNNGRTTVYLTWCFLCYSNG